MSDQVARSSTAQHVVIATAEPRGAYHLEPMYPAMRAANAARFTHLVPYPEPVQGAAWDHTSHDVTVLETATRVVVTGGGYTAWTELVAHRAQQLGIELVVSELAYGAVPDTRLRPKPSALSVMSPSGADVFAEYHGYSPADVVVTGIPLLDTLPVWQPRPRKALLLSTAGAAERDPDEELHTVAKRLRDAGWEVVVRLHPREDRTPWAAYPLDSSPTAALAAADASVVIGYPGSAHAVVAALGVPVVALVPNDVMRNALPEQQRSVIPTWVKRADDLDLAAMPASTRSSIDYVCGPVGGAASRVVEFWTR